ncbi:hypothetical protein LY76DRAFT_216607 [Colletotrichum caudatum]|nr:hypothetical protein LY76DRAFT_216607 [Colletotrichum caudatum]
MLPIEPLAGTTHTHTHARMRTHVRRRPRFLFLFALPLSLGAAPAYIRIQHTRLTAAAAAAAGAVATQATRPRTDIAHTVVSVSSAPLWPSCCRRIRIPRSHIAGWMARGRHKYIPSREANRTWYQPSQSWRGRDEHGWRWHPAPSLVPSPPGPEHFLDKDRDHL